MARRQEVFQAKVLQKLYPAAPRVEKQPSPPRMVDALSRKKHARRIASNQDAATGVAGTAASQGRRMYTVLPPPADYKPHSEDSVTPSQLESINSAEDPAEDDVNEEPDEEEEEEEQKRRRRRRKRKAAPQQDSGKDAAAESSTGQTPVAEEGQNISKNKRRKLKKKRHKQKLLDMGLMPRATALEFTYRKDEEEEEEEEEDYEKKAAEVSDFLKTTMEIYMSDSSLHMADHPVLSETVTDLLSSLAGEHRSTSVLGLLCRLKAFVQQRQTDALEKALEELLNTSPMSAGETTAVTSLFRYWITQIFPVQGDKKTGLSTGPL